MRKFFKAILFIGIGVSGCYFTLNELGLLNKLGLLKMTRAYSMGYTNGYWEGVSTCPCWKREGNICSLCQIKLGE